MIPYHFDCKQPSILSKINIPRFHTQCKKNWFSISDCAVCVYPNWPLSKTFVSLWLIFVDFLAVVTFTPHYQYKPLNRESEVTQEVILADVHLGFHNINTRTTDKLFTNLLLACAVLKKYFAVSLIVIILYSSISKLFCFSLLLYTLKLQQAALGMFIFKLHFKDFSQWDVNNSNQNLLKKYLLVPWDHFTLSLSNFQTRIVAFL